MNARHFCYLVLALLLSVSAHAARQHDPPPGDTPRTEQGVINEIDLENRIGIIGGFEYQFGSAFEPLEVKMYGSSAGAVELLQVGMKVEVVYLDREDTRIALSIQELASDAEVEF